MGYSGCMKPLPPPFRWASLGLPFLAVAALLVAPVPTFADNQTSSEGQRSSQTEKQRSKQEQTRRGKFQYHHYESENRVRDFHDNPNRQPHFIERRVGFSLSF